MSGETGQQTVDAQAVAQEYWRLIEDGWSPDLDEFLGRVPGELRPRVEALIRAERSPHDPAAFACGYLELLDEGWEPDLEEYLRRVPDEVREAVLVLIDEALANPPEVVEEPLLEPCVEIEAPGEELAVEPGPEPDVDGIAIAAPGPVGRVAARLLPAAIRDAWIGEWAFAREDRRALGLSALEVNLLSIDEVIDGIAQHAPLLGEAEGGAGGGLRRLCWGAWRLGGPVLLAGTLVASLPVAAAGFGLVALSVAGALAVRRRDDAATLVNGVLGGLCVAVVCSLLLLAIALGPAAVAVATGHQALALRGVCLLATLPLACVAARGRVPAPWSSRRLAPLRGRGG